MTCGGQFGSVPLSLRAYHDGRETVMLVAHHAACADSVWLDVGAEVPAPQPTWTATTATMALPLGPLRPLHWLLGGAARSHTFPVMFVRPSLEVAQVRPVFAGETVNADMERYCRLGFSEPAELAACADPLRALCRAWLRTSGQRVSVAAMAGDQAWSATAEPEVAELVSGHGGIMIAITCDHDLGRLSADRHYLDRACGNGELLLGWAQLSPNREPAPEE